MSTAKSSASADRSWWRQPERRTSIGATRGHQAVRPRAGADGGRASTSPPGQVTALAGDNGAGKSVTIKTIAGLWQPDEGELLWEGKPVNFQGPRDAEAQGITTIYQDLALCENLDIVQNMFLGHEKLRHLLLDEGTMELAAKKTLMSCR